MSKVVSVSSPCCSLERACMQVQQRDVDFFPFSPDEHNALLEFLLLSTGPFSRTLSRLVNMLERADLAELGEDLRDFAVGRFNEAARRLRCGSYYTGPSPPRWTGTFTDGQFVMH